MFEAVRSSATGDVSCLPLPAALRVHLSTTTRHGSVHDQDVSVDPTWWRTVLGDTGLPGDPPGGTRRDGHTRELLCRRRLFELGDTVGHRSSPETVLSFLWHVMAWGSPPRGRRRRVSSLVGRIPETVDALRTACEQAGSDPVAGYRTLRPRGSGGPPGLGPALSTGVLYFAGGGRADHPALILNEGIAAALHAQGWDLSPTAAHWSGRTYDRYCVLLGRWAREASRQLGRPVGADEIEVWLSCQAGADPAASTRPEGRSRQL
ncbi:hypothetical protein [Janibacter sp. UYMM211]|uniref:8-oxoguanine DNA glycosylase OGG fold protein n=1 Tax=Janibacter sp. UYMM211 TaxID=3156342 RepID=UPI003396C261